MTIEQLKNKHPIIEEIEEISSEDGNSYEVIFVLGGAKSFDGTEEERLTAIDEYCTRIENIIKNLK